MMARARWPSGGRLLLALLWLWGAAADVLYGGEECTGIVNFPLKDDTNFTAVDVRCRPRSLPKGSPLPPMLLLVRLRGWMNGWLCGVFRFVDLRGGVVRRRK
jgi:hypothetical protein